jgi:predicted ATPase
MAQALRRVSADGFRSLGHVDVDFGPLSVLVGPNGSGKSNLLQVLAFVRDTARFNTAQAVALRGGFTHILRQDGETERVRLTIEAVVSEFASKGATDKYTLELAEDDHGDIDREEELLYKTVRGAGRRQKIQASGSEVAIGDTKQIRDRGYLTLSSDDVSALGTVARLNSEELGSGPSAFFDFLSSVRYLDPNVDLARAPSRVSQTALDDDASNLASALRALHESHPDDFTSLERDLAKCLPGLVEIQFGIVGGSSTSVVVRLVERGVIEPIDLADASFGTVRLLALLTALHDPEPPQLTIIEEIDHGLHPYALDVLVDRMRAASARTQIIVASHSPTLVNRLQADEIIICDRDPETGESVIPAIEPETLAAVLEGSDWKAGELWFSGALDGVPR